MHTRRLAITLVIIFLAIVSVYSLWNTPILLISAIICISLLKHYLTPIKKEFIMYIISAIVGACGESIIMIGGPWAYATSDIANFPIWLPFLWGLAGITGISLHQSISEK